jgi:hypothetical protein
MSDSARPTALIPAKRPLWRRILKWTLRVVAALVVLLVVAGSVGNYLTGRALNREVEKIRAAGEPLTFAQLARHADKPNYDQDAAPYYGAALLLQKRSEQVDESLTSQERLRQSGERTLPADQAAATRDLLAQNGLALELIDRGAGLASCDFDIGVEYGIGPVMPRLSKARGLVKLTSVRTEFLAMQGQSDKAVDSAISALRMTRMFDAQPMLIAHLTKVACLAQTSGDVPVILESGSPSRPSLEKLQQALLEVEQAIDMKRVWLTERVYSMEIMRSLLGSQRELQADADNRPAMPEAWWPGLSGPMFRWMATGTLRRYAEYIALTGPDWPANLAAAEAISARPQGSRWSQYLLADVLAPSLSRMVQLSARMVASLRCSRVAVLIELYRLDTGRLPDTLQDVEAAGRVKLPDDPFTGKPLIYRKTTDGYLIYSLDDSRQDLGGPSTQPADHDNRGYRIRLAAPAGQGHPTERTAP